MKRKLISSILALCVVITAMAGLFVMPVSATTVTDWAASEITLANEDDLKAFVSELSGGRNFAGQTIKLGRDMDLNPGWDASSKTAPKNGYTWPEISKSFNGTFDGQNHTIKGVYSVISTVDDTGIFGKTVAEKDSDGNVLTTTIASLSIENSYVKLQKWRNGALISVAYTNNKAKLVIDNVDNGIIVDSVMADARVYGAFVGNVRDGASVTITNSVFTGTITNNKNVKNISGFVGGSNTPVTLTNCAFLGNSDANGTYFYGSSGTSAPVYTNCYYVADSDITSYTAPAGVTKVGSMVGSDIVLSSAADVMGFANLLAAGFEDFSGMTVKLGGDVDLNPGWTAPAGVVETWGGSTATNHWPLIKAGTGFAGTFDGQGHTVSGLHYAKYAAGGTGNNYGIFGRLPAGKTATVKNVTFDNSYALFRSWQSTGLYGSVSGNLTLENVNNGININTYTDGSDSLAGMVGSVNSGATVNIINSTVSGTLSGVSSGKAHAGGFVGVNNGTLNVSGCEFSGSIKTTYSDKYVAGIVGYVNAGEVNIENTVVTGDISTPYFGAGFVGYVTANMTVSIENSAMYGMVECTKESLNQGVYPTAGLIYDNRGVATLKQCIVGGEVDAGTNSSGLATSAYIIFNAGGTVNSENNIFCGEANSNTASKNNGKQVDVLTGIEAQAVLAENGITGMVATTKGYPMPKALVKEYTPEVSEDAVNDYVGYQTTKLAANGSFNLRLVGNLDANADLEGYEKVGFKVVAFFENNDAVMYRDCEITTVYEAITTSYDGTSTYTEAGKYLFVQECINLTTAYGDITFEVTTYATDTDGTTVEGATYRFVVDVSEIPSAS